jgi:acetyl-CoA carboxylase biotin carboxyl carrier protein
MAENQSIPVKAPISGVFYRAPAPDQPAFVEVGSSVRKGQTLCLLETMKVFTKIKSPTDGVVVEILGTNEVAIEKNQVLFYIKPQPV